MTQITYIRFDVSNKDFLENCKLLDGDLENRVGKVIPRDKYTQYNLLDKIHEAIVVYRDNQPIGGGDIRTYDESTAELKRVLYSKLGFKRIQNYGVYVNMSESLCMEKKLK